MSESHLCGFYRPVQTLADPSILFSRSPARENRMQANPSVSTRNPVSALAGTGFFVVWRDSNHVRTCRRHVHESVQTLEKPLFCFPVSPKGKRNAHESLRLHFSIDIDNGLRNSQNENKIAGKSHSLMSCLIHKHPMPSLGRVTASAFQIPSIFSSLLRSLISVCNYVVLTFQLFVAMLCLRS